VPALGLSLLPGISGERAEPVKNLRERADTNSTMIISEEQVRLAADYLRTHDTQGRSALHGEVPEHLLKQVQEILAKLPETRDERVTEAKHRLKDHPPTADEIAGKIIGRAISDSLR
jgi:hypothetical protein